MQSDEVWHFPGARSIFAVQTDNSVDLGRAPPQVCEATLPAEERGQFGPPVALGSGKGETEGAPQHRPNKPGVLAAIFDAKVDRTPFLGAKR